MRSKAKDWIRQQLTRGLSPDKLSLALLVALSVSIFPLLGLSTVVGLLLAHLLKLNHAIIQSINQVLTPLQVLMVGVWIKTAEAVFRFPPFPFSPLKIIELFKADPVRFLKQFGTLGLAAVFLWILFVTTAVILVRPYLRHHLEKLLKALPKKESL